MHHLTNIYSIVPRLPPAINGVGDYALNLARQLRKDFHIQTHFIVGNPKWNGGSEIEGFPITRICDRNAQQLLSQDQTSSVLLHYVGYGYAKRGCPVGLVERLQRWKNSSPDCLFVTMFHELYASGSPPWTSSFWLSPLQKSLAAKLAKLSDRCVTSRKGYAEIIRQLSDGKHQQILALPVFSNVGEPQEIPLPLSQRQNQLVVFGGVASRIRVYRDCQARLDYVCRKLNIQTIIDIGTSTGIAPRFIGNVPVSEIGEQPPDKVSHILANSIAGFCDYNPDYFGKSTILAAYCAHRLLPINARGSDSITDGIQENHQYWVPSDQENNSRDELDMQAIADQAYSWYQNHRLSIQSESFMTILNKL